MFEKNFLRRLEDIEEFYFFLFITYKRYRTEELNFGLANEIISKKRG